MKFNAKFICFCLLSLLCLASCAKKQSIGANDAAKRYFDAWLSINYPDALPVDSLFEVYYEPKMEEVGTGNDLSDCTYVFVHFVKRDLDGTITATNMSVYDKQLGQFDTTFYYDPVVWSLTTTYAGLEKGIKGMKEGGKRRLIVPSWMMTLSRYGDKGGYLANGTENSHSLYDITVYGGTTDIIKWEASKLDAYVKSLYPGLDSLEYGFYYRTVDGHEPTDTTAFPKDTTFYVNYIGKLTNGKAFDTNIKDSAKVFNLYSSSVTYSPKKITWASSANSIQFDGSTPIRGFYTGLWKMRANEWAEIFCTSSWAYGNDVQNSLIPAYSPLHFEIRIVENE